MTQTTQNEDYKGLLHLLGTPMADEYFGRAFVLRLDVIAALLKGGRGGLSDVARKHGVTRAAASHQARRFLRIYGKSLLPS
jgi:hypothetical protein